MLSDKAKLKYLHCRDVIVIHLTKNKLTEDYLQLTAGSKVLLQKPKAIQIVKKFPASYGTRWFIVMFTRFLPWTRKIQSTLPNPIFLRFVLILSSDIWLSLPSGLLISGFLLCVHISCKHASYMPRPSHRHPNNV